VLRSGAGRPGRSRYSGMRRPTFLVALVGVLWLVLLPSALAGQHPSDVLRIHFFDVGQGDAILIDAPTGQRVLIDAGPDAGIVPRLRGLGVDSIDLFIASHNHADHIGGAAAVIEALPVRFFMDNGVPHTTVTYRTMLEALAKRDTELLEPERRTITFGEAALHILAPPGDPALGHNDNSIGVLLRFGDFRAMLAGDAERHVWQHWLRTSPDEITRVHVHKASHHGSANGDIPQALDRLRPRLVVVSAGADNPYGHPHPAALALYAEVGADVLVTAEEGTVEVLASQDGQFDVVSERERAKMADADPDFGQADSGCLDLNRTDLETLQEITHVGPERAVQIVALREQRPFASLEDLTRVEGIGPSRLKQIQEQGLACVW
jgi:competence protein ComEC